MIGKKEIGSFIELMFPTGLEYYKGNNLARVNSGRAAIYYSLKSLHCKVAYLPYYQCSSVRHYLLKNGIEIRYYTIDDYFNPVLDSIPDEAAIILVNYFGIMKQDGMQELASRFKHVIIDNAQAFFAPPIEGCYNCYSPRKFVGVPDGGYVVGDQVRLEELEMQQDYSSDTSLFLLQRIEYGCEGKAYDSREKNEERITSSGLCSMSKLTHTILDGIDYHFVIEKRRENYETARQLFHEINLIDPDRYWTQSCVPMVYPLVIERKELHKYLIMHKIFQGRWWSYVKDEVSESSFEYYLSQYMIPITIDQRYGKEDLEYMYQLIKKGINL